MMKPQRFGDHVQFVCIKGPQRFAKTSETQGHKSFGISGPLGTLINNYSHVQGEGGAGAK